MRITSPRADSGFTFIELLVAITILSAAFAILVAVFARNIKGQRYAEAQDLAYSQARISVARLVSDIEMAFLSDHHPDAENSLTFFRGKREGDFDRLAFTTMAHQWVRKNAKESDQTEVAYKVVELDGDGDEKKTWLVRREAPRIDDDADHGGRFYRLADNVAELHFRYWDIVKEEWVDEWDSEGVDAKGRLPEYVEIQMTFLDADSEKVALSTRASIGMWKNRLLYTN